MPLNPKSVTPGGSADESKAKQPLWRAHFPVDTEAEAAKSRREFIGGAAVAGGVIACGHQVLNASDSGDMDVATSQVGEEGEATDTRWIQHKPLTLAKSLPQMKVGETVLFHYPNHRSPCLLVKHSESSFSAFAQKCTHLACPVVPDLDAQEFHCPCHHGVFDLRTGEPKAGPPRSSLPRIDVFCNSDGSLTARAIEVVG